eukprot:scaffold2630_cov118-Isochrysis_galbana.AAC.11
MQNSGARLTAMDPLFILAGLGDMEPAEDDDDVPSQGMAVDPLFSMAGFDFATPTGGPQPTPRPPVAGAHLGVAREWVLGVFIYVRADEVRAVLAPEIETVLQTFKKVQNPLAV